ncbi:MAG: Uma2 family endonuclease [Gammaproteobacteria bacterium]|nr:Uma2 family endonuclease [Gammaproteobacteria bacterium]
MRKAEPIYPVGNRNRVIFPEPPGGRPLAPEDYPVRDGNPMAETPIHRRATVDAVMPLEFFFKNRTDVYVGCDMLLYYREGDVNGNVVPDVWVAFGVPKLPERNNWLLWLEGKGPDFVLEITSENTELEDEGRKKRVYEELGVREYWQFDPEGDYLDPILKGHELGPDGKYRDLVLKEHEEVLCHQSLLGLELCLEGDRLFYFDPVQNVRLLTCMETADALRAAEESTQASKAECDLRMRLLRGEIADRRAAEKELDRLATVRRAANARIAELERRLRAN